jgi:chromosomal replication initiation ATPase DnaA
MLILIANTVVIIKKKKKVINVKYWTVKQVQLHILVGNRTRVLVTKRAIIAYLEHGCKTTSIPDIGKRLGEPIAFAVN